METKTVSTSIAGVTVHGVQPQVNSIEGNKRTDDIFTHDTFTTQALKETTQTLH